ncbi:MAG: bifunctional demethylmenaquinone methyltransferase/2-methoxy-6-polyprenyl-1,4-benzoquinol methylase UbiE [Planctomycetes bacterium]|nr:bifunctional demethylmenaquinone methyltransferase/2-methoxy-6-polyprenyl-1,4-benzoquinol methylase UbiE [Planctomycetota bacterium]MBL7145050.1 bifunctional demethylmenaquinone methyltransferase/2-methoxy-6-polyprenyl-1,4-benzoquinol methylase UbiE [Phycisphaerae bacterium]
MTHAEPVREYPAYNRASKQNLSNPKPVNGSSADAVCRMFDSIAPYYVVLNHVLSFGWDFIWRRKLANTVNNDKKLKVLDLATGTGDLLISLLRRNPNITEAVGLDISENMLALCRERIAKNKLSDRVSLVRSDAADSGLPDESFDVVTMGFGIRNTPDVFKTLCEIHRLLRRGGTVLILEFSLPSNRIIKKCYLLYLRNFVPMLGRLLSGDKNAYRYLNTSVEKFYSVDDFSSIMRKAGFNDVSAAPLTFGIVCMYKASKASTGS